MDYSLKVNWYYKGVVFTPCDDCPFRNKRPAVPIWEKTEKCFQRCPYEIVIWILSKRQLALYEKVRPSELQKKELKRAKKEEKIVIVEQIRGALEISAPSFY